MFVGTSCCWSCLTAEAVQGTALPLQSVDHIHGGDGLPLGVFGVGDGVTDDVLKEDLEDTAGLLVDQARDTLDSTTASQTADGGLGDALDIVPEDLAVTLSASLSQTLASLATSSHVDQFYQNERMRLLCLCSTFYTQLHPVHSGQLVVSERRKGRRALVLLYCSS